MRQLPRNWLRALVKFRSDDRAAVAVIFALALPVVVGMLAFAVEGGIWTQSGRSMQNAADEAAIAAATNGTSTYDNEAKSVAAKYGYLDGASNIVVSPRNNWPCPDGIKNNCYKVDISRNFPLIFSQVVSFLGNAANGTMLISATAVAKQGQREYCLVALGTPGVDFRTNGAPTADLTGCSILSSADMRCNGSNLSADFGDAVGTNIGNTCGLVATSGVPPITDLYALKASKIPPNPCLVFAPSTMSGPQSWSTPTTICGDLKLTGNVTVSGPNNLLVIRNGGLNLNGFSITSAPGAGLTIIFSSPDSAGTIHAPTGGGMLDIAAPTSGDWSGVALYQDPALTSGVDITAAGNSPAWNITGLVYLPHASVTFSGIVNKASNGTSCFVLVADNILINGTAKILARGGCAAAGLDFFAGRGRLVS